MAKADKSDSNNPPISAIFSSDELMSPRYRTALLNQVLNEFPRLPAAAQRVLRLAVDNEVVLNIGGFRRGQAGRALDRSSFLLHEPLMHVVRTSDVLAAAVLHCWAESQPALQEAARQHLKERGLETPGPDLQGKAFRSQWLMVQWEEERESFASAHLDAFDADDAGLAALSRAQLLERQGQSKAADAYWAVLEEDAAPGLVEWSLFSRADLRTQQGRLDEAMALYQHQIAHFPQGDHIVAAHLGLAALYERQGAIEQARKTYETALLQHPHDARAPQVRLHIERLRHLRESG